MLEIDFLRTVFDETDVCAYLPGQTARMPLSEPTSPLSHKQFDSLLAAGYRRSGWYFYRTQCPNCAACEPLRIEVSNFVPSRSQKRAQRIGDRHLQAVWAEPTIDARRLEIFNQHRDQRELNRGEATIYEAEYRAFLINSHTDVIELTLWIDDTLIAVSITDVGATSLSAVYCFFDPDFARYSPGTYAILQQIELARANSFRWLYLGMYVAANRHLKYKANFGPNERLLADGPDRVNRSWIH